MARRVDAMAQASRPRASARVVSCVLISIQHEQSELGIVVETLGCAAQQREALGLRLRLFQ
jgi:hypothetical protein